MVKLGYALSSEEHTPSNLVRNAQKAEETGFQFALISDHFHPWTDSQGQSPFVWSVLGAIALATYKMQVGTGLTCPMIRTHPAIIAQAAATIGAMMPGRFFLGVGTGERLNEHITGLHWPPFDIRAEMLEESVEVIRLLWQGGDQSHYGKHYTVENARIYTLPEKLPEIMVGASAEKAAELAGRIGDGLISTVPKKEIVKAFSRSGKNRPKYGQLTVCWAKSEKEARKTALLYWPIAAMEGPGNQEFSVPAHFEEAAKGVTEEDMGEAIVCGNDPKKHLAAIQEYIDAGFDHIYIHQIGPDQDGFFKFYQEQILPTFELETQKVQ
jgi:coenzyme F420-dependent glucose-6-phosphate dehydrogenase